MSKSSSYYKQQSIREFTRIAKSYETDHAGVYNLCKKDYPDILEELEKEPFTDLLDAGCGPAPMITLLSEKYPEKHYTGLDLTPAMIEQAKKKKIPNAEFVVGDCENFPFA
ncbi:MAG: class I SAM-dependent methyltransferase, partial [Lachnospiraceae bacterium]|nr:class I SAM-dependent methyltransferase [Lachnospiraceae bacterium]